MERGRRSPGVRSGDGQSGTAVPMPVRSGGFLGGLSARRRAVVVAAVLLVAGLIAALVVPRLADRLGSGLPAVARAGPAGGGSAGAGVRRRNRGAAIVGGPDPGNRADRDRRPTARRRHRRSAGAGGRAGPRGHRCHGGRRRIGRHRRILRRRRGRPGLGAGVRRSAARTPHRDARLAAPRRADRGGRRGSGARRLPDRVPAAGAGQQPARRTAVAGADPAGVAVGVDVRTTRRSPRRSRHDCRAR